MTRPLSLILSLTLLLSLCGLTVFASPARPRGDGPAFDGTNYRRRKARRTRRHKPRNKRAVALQQQQQQPTEPKFDEMTLPSSPQSPSLYKDDGLNFSAKPTPGIKPPMGKPDGIKPPMNKPKRIVF